MIIYNVTVNIEDEVREEWLSWMRERHIPDVMATGRFVENKMMRLLNEQPGVEGATYCIQYFCPSLDDLESYLEKDAPALQKEHSALYQDKFVAFRTFLEVID